MSSTSSSLCNCDYRYWPRQDMAYNMDPANYRNAFGGNPFCAAMGQPLVYCVQTPRDHRGRNRERGSPNCFVKAFRWYTKEHKPSGNESEAPIKPDMTGFAAWLDLKYDQFLQENRQLGSETYHIKVRQTLEAQRVSNNYCYPCAGQRLIENSTWRKNRRSKSNEGKPVQQRSNHSCRYIMQPKDLSHPTSVCCPPKESHLCSNISTTASESEIKHLAKSRSISNTTLVIQRNEPCNPNPPPNSMNDSKPKEHVCQKASCKSKPLGQAEISDVNDVKSKGDVGEKASCARVTSIQSIEKVAIKIVDECKSKDDTCQTKSCKHTSSKQAIENVEILKMQNTGPVGDTCESGTRICSKPPIEKIETSPRDKVSKDFGCQCQFLEDGTTKVNTETQYERAPPNVSYGTPLQPMQSERIVSNNCPCIKPNIQKPTSSFNQGSNQYQPVSNQYHPVSPGKLSADECDCQPDDEMPRKQTSRVHRNPSKHSQRNVKLKGYKDVECFCPRENFVNTQAQYAPRPMTNNNTCTNMCDCEFKGFRQNQTVVQSVPLPSDPVCYHERRDKEELVSVKFAQTTAQTSNHSICFDKGTVTVHEYPLFLKIVCADKLS